MYQERSQHNSWPDAPMRARSLARAEGTAGARSGDAARAVRVRRRQRAVRPLILVACCAFGSLAFASLTDGGRLARQAAPLSEQIDGLLVRLGFGVDEVWLAGHRYTLDADLFAVLDLEKTGSLLRFDPRQARARIEELAWIDTADVTRVFPNKLRIEVRERKPFAVWRHLGRQALVDSTGRVLAYVTPGAAPELPRISGAKAPPAAAELFAALRRHPQIARHVETAERVGGRRWMLFTEGGSVVHLPAQAQDAAIDRLAELQERQHILDQSPVSIDLRLPRSIAIRKGGVLLGRTTDDPLDVTDGRG